MAALRHLARRGLRLLPSPMDGHCLLHIVCCSWQSQLSHFRTIDLESIKSNIFIETVANAENYTSFLSSHLSLSRGGLRSYLIDQHYNFRFGDLVPLTIANTLSVQLDILNENDNQFEYVPILPCGNAIASLILNRQGEHYNGVGPCRQPVSRAPVLIVNPTWVPTPAGTPAAHSKQPIKTASTEYHRWSRTTLKTPIFKMRSSPTVPQN